MPIEKRQMTPDEHPLDGAEWADLHPTATMWGIIVASLGLALLAYVWWPP